MTRVIDGIQYHDNSVEMVARAIRAVNPHAANYPEQSLIDTMRRDAKRLAAEGDLGYTGTLGYVISLYRGEKGIGAKASVDAYSVLKHLGLRVQS